MAAGDRVEGETLHTYLGDGVYASFDGYQIWLRADRFGIEQAVAVEPEVMAQLVIYAAKVFGEKP
jgi:hypothetical protein